MQKRKIQFSFTLTDFGDDIMSSSLISKMQAMPTAQLGLKKILCTVSPVQYVNMGYTLNSSYYS